MIRPRELARGFVDDAYAEAAAFAQDYELLRFDGQTPDELLVAVSEMTGAINDAPVDDLDIEDEAFPAERIRNYEDATIKSGHRLYRVIARHRETRSWPDTASWRSTPRPRRSPTSTTPRWCGLTAGTGSACWSRQT